jgi:hypothetical protein
MDNIRMFKVLRLLERQTERPAVQMVYRVFVSVAAGVIFGMTAWFISQIGLLVSFYTYQLCGQFIAPIFNLLAGWPIYIFSLFLPEQLPDFYYQYAYLINLRVSFIGWVILGSILSIGWHHYRIHRSQRKAKRGEFLGD